MRTINIIMGMFVKSVVAHLLRAWTDVNKKAPIFRLMPLHNLLGTVLYVSVRKCDLAGITSRDLPWEVRPPRTDAFDAGP